MDKRSSEAASAIALAISPRITPRAELVTAVRLNGVASAAHAHWRQLVRQKIAPTYRRYLPLGPNETDEMVSAAHLERLLDFQNFAGISDIWMSSEFVKDSELNAAGKRREKPLTRLSLGQRLQEVAEEAAEFANASAYQTRAKRLVDAMLSFGLVEEACERPNRKPLWGTARLHALMVAYHVDLATLWKWAVDGVDLTTQGEACND